MPRTLIMSTLTALALLARALMCAVPTHWVIVALSYAFDGEADGDVDLSGMITGLVILAWGGGVLVARRQPEARARMALGPQTVSQWRPLVLSVGTGAVLGGLALRADGSEGAAALSILMGAAILLFELLAIAGSQVGPTLDLDELPTVTEPIELPRWVAPLAYWLTIGPFIVLAGSRVAVTPTVLILGLLGVTEETMNLAYWPIQIVGYGVGIGLAWVVWRQIVGYLSGQAA